MQSLFEGSSIIIVRGNAMPSPQAKVKQEDGKVDIIEMR
jgi:hypothetical protein